MKGNPNARVQPAPANPGVTKWIVREPARRLFRAKWPRQPHIRQEWWLAEQYLVRCPEAEAL